MDIIEKKKELINEINKLTHYDVDDNINYYCRLSNEPEYLPINFFNRDLSFNFIEFKEKYKIYYDINKTKELLDKLHRDDYKRYYNYDSSDDED